MTRQTATLLALVPALALTLWLDCLEPGWGRFYNPLFWVRAQVSKLDTDWRSLPTIDASHPLLTDCLQHTGGTVLTKAQEDARAILTGKAESFALQQLGAPTCALGNGVYRWVSESGLAVDVTFQDGTVKDAKLNR